MNARLRAIGFPHPRWVWALHLHASRLIQKKGRFAVNIWAASNKYVPGAKLNHV
jgi:hypothetical protein